jgi:hypothetical protein
LSTFYFREAPSVWVFFVNFAWQAQLITILGYFVSGFLIERQFSAAIAGDAYQIQTYNTDGS